MEKQMENEENSVTHNNEIDNYSNLLFWNFKNLH